MIPSNQSNFSEIIVRFLGAHRMGIYLRHVLVAIYVFITVTRSDHEVNSDHLDLDKQRISECHDGNEDCLAARRNGETDDILLRLPRIDGVKVNTIIYILVENNG